jgi:hypothetical protein
MNPNQRSEVNNQTNNGANEKGTPGSQGKTIADAPLDHTYPQGAAQQQGQGGTQQSGAGPAAPSDVTQQRGSAGQDLQGGSMQTQQTGGTGAVQGITDSHQRAMEDRSGAYGQLEQPVGERSRQSGELRNNNQSGFPSSDDGSGPIAAQQGGNQAGRSTGTPSVQRSEGMGAQQSTDRAGSQTGSYQGGTHQSNDTAGGLPRSPGNTGASSGPSDTHLTGAQVHANQQKDPGGVHKSNDLAGGYPKSPGGANKLAADEKMDDDTGFSNKP